MIPQFCSIELLDHRRWNSRISEIEVLACKNCKIVRVEQARKWFCFYHIKNGLWIKTQAQWVKTLKELKNSYFVIIHLCTHTHETVPVFSLIAPPRHLETSMTFLLYYAKGTHIILLQKQFKLPSASSSTCLLFSSTFFFYAKGTHVFTNLFWQNLLFSLIRLKPVLLRSF